MSLPPLRERKEEIPILLKHFMSRMSESYARSPLPLSPPLMEACLRHNWPGNLRELSNFIKRYLVLGDRNSGRVRIASPGPMAVRSARRRQKRSRWRGVWRRPEVAVRVTRKTEPKRKPSPAPWKRQTGIANKPPCCLRSATKRFSIRFASTASPKAAARTGYRPVRDLTES